MSEAGLDRTIAALAEPARRQVVDLLSQGPLRAGELARATGMSAPAMSRHLRVLKRSHIIIEDRVEADARVKLYRLVPKPFNELSDWLEEVRAFWQGKLAALKHHVEQSQRDEE
ncbi:MAG: metalloregulator ArsR/SmtB family transcription factor [Alphaproteobacteria bacterium]